VLALWGAALVVAALAVARHVEEKRLA